MDSPADIKPFIGKYIGSVQQVEVLLILVREPEKSFSAADIAKKANLDITAASNRLLSLCLKGLVMADEGLTRTFRYRPRDAFVEMMVMKLKSAYERDPAQIVSLIYCKRDDQLRDFSDAFRLNQDDEPPSEA